MAQPTETVQQFGVRRTVRAIELECGNLDEVVIMTPTGRKRELLTEANIHLHEARRKLRDALLED